LPLADLFMGMMLSRPRGLSLRTAWVTPATLALACCVAFLAFPAGAVLLVMAAARPQLLLAALALGAISIGLGAFCLAVYGIRQRRI
jgi:hypothetical protein